MKIIPALIAAAVLASTPSLALADTPVPSQSNGPGQIVDTPLKTSNDTITGTGVEWGLDWFELTYDATRKSAVLQVSTKAPTQNIQGVYSMGATQPVVLTGKGSGTPDIDSLALPGQKYAFSQKVEGLDEGTTYHFLITLPVSPGFKAVQVVGSVRTEHHSPHIITRRTTGLDLDFTASGGSATVSISTSPTIVGSKLKGSTPVVVKGTPQANTNRFTHSFENLTPGTKYYVLAIVSGSQSTQRLTQTSTKTQQVEVTVEKIKVIDDGDPGIRGKGELLFQIRGTDSAAKASLWGGHYGETKIGSGDSVTLAGSPKAPAHTFTTTQSSFVVQVEGRESDAPTKSARQFCEEHYSQPNQKHAARWLNKADSGVNCYQFSYAETGFDLRAGSVQTRTFSVARSPEVRFEVTVRMTATAL